MVQVNENYLKLKAGYLFPEIAKRVKLYSQSEKSSKIKIIAIKIALLKEKNLTHYLRWFSKSKSFRINYMSQQIIIAEQARIAALLTDDRVDELIVAQGQYQIGDIFIGTVENVLPGICLLYTSDAADE